MLLWTYARTHDVDMIKRHTTAPMLNLQVFVYY